MNQNPQQPPQRPIVYTPPSSRVNSFLAVLVFMLAIWLLYTQVWPRIYFGSAASRPIDPRGDLIELEKTTTQLFEYVAPSVVFVTNAQYRRDWRTRQVQSVARGSGTGFIWDNKGHIVTNYHVVEGAERIIVTFANKESVDAVVVGASRNNDLAVLRVGAAPSYFNPIPIGTSADLKVGQEVFAIGNPFGFDQTLTRGIVSALNRDLPEQNGVVLHDLIQTDAAINPGNSGGPLLDSAARLIGVNTAIISPSQANAGIGFSIPVDEVNRIVPQLINNGRPVKPVLGVRLENSRFRFRGKNWEGLRIARIYPDSPAEKAGLVGDHYDNGYSVPGDIIKSIDGQKITDIDSFNKLIKTHAIGDTITVRVETFSITGTKEKEVQLTLAAGPDG